MSFLYHQATGLLEHNGISLGSGYSGHGPGINNPAMQQVRMIGPIPSGTYNMQQPTMHPELGPISMELQPWSTNQMFLRDGFFMHGDNSKGDRSASEGCIIMDRIVRGMVSASVLDGDNKLEVVA